MDMFETLKDGNFKHQEIWLAAVLNGVTAIFFLTTVIIVYHKWRNQMFLMLTPWFIMTSAAVNMKNVMGYRQSTSLIYYFEAWPLAVVHWVFAIQYL